MSAPKVCPWLTEARMFRAVWLIGAAGIALRLAELLS